MKNHPLIFFAPVLAGCVTWESIGVTSTRTYNAHIEELEVFKKDALAPIESLGEVTQELAQEDIREAELDKDMDKLKRSTATLTKAQIATKDINRLEERTSFTKAPEPTFDFDLEHIISGLMGGGGVMGILLSIMLPKMKRLKVKALEYAQSTEVNDISKDRDLA